jgi:hypothetical protein
MNLIFISPYNIARTLAAVLLATTMNLTGPAYAGPCAQASLDTKSAGASRNKFGFQGCHTTSPPTYYLVNNITDSLSINHNQCDNPNNDFWSQNGSLNTTDVHAYNMSQAHIDPNTHLWTAPTTDNYSGNASYNYFSCCPNNQSPESATLNSTGQWSDSGKTAGDIGFLQYEFIDNSYYSPFITTTPKCTQTIDEVDTTGSYSYYNSDGTGEDWSYVEHSMLDGKSLSEVYTDGMLRSDVLSIMPAYPAAWATNSNSSAYYHLTTSDPVTGSCGKMMYRIHITDCVADPNVSYRAHWDEVTTYDNGGSSTKHMQETIPGTADPVNGAIGSPHEIGVPGTPGAITVNVQNPPEIIQNGSPGQ